MMIIRSKAPFRLGLAGGGTDVSPYSDMFGGAILNATISLYARTTLIPTNNGKIVFTNADKSKTYTFDSKEELELNGDIDLQIGIYNRIVKTYSKAPLSFEMTTSMDVPTGSGLGTSSTLVVSILGAFVEWLKLPLGEYDIAHLAYEIERVDLGMKGGKQDQYAATFGGVNFLEFLENDKVIVNPLRTKKSFLNELNFVLVLYYTKTSRESAKIIEKQIDNVKKSDSKPIEAMHKLKKQAFDMKQAFLISDINRIGEILHESWLNKKQMASGISNDLIDGIYEKAIQAGATGGKISGAGGGGFMMFFAPKTSRYNVIEALQEFGGDIVNYDFVNQGLYTWTVE
ncbi:MAG: dehydrogenase [Crocinitomicaceae bacterium]|nr:dehydrogenase [Crocinitomicaceae bacterium]